MRRLRQQRLKWVCLSSVQLLKVRFSERNRWANFGNNIYFFGYIQQVLSLLPQNLQPPNLVGWWLKLRTPTLPSYMSLWSCGLAMSRKKIKLLRLHFHRTNEHQTWHSGDLGWGAPTCLDKYLRSCGHVMSRDKIKSLSPPPQEL